MPNCAIYGCGSCDKHELSLFKLPMSKTEFYVNWKDDILKIITRDRVVDLGFRTLIEKDECGYAKNILSQKILNIHVSITILPLSWVFLCIRVGVG